MFARKDADISMYDFLRSSKKLISRFKLMNPKRQGSVLLGLSLHMQQKILRELSDSEITRILKTLNSNEAADVIQAVERSRASSIVENLNADTKEDVRFLIKFNPNTAAGIMRLDYISVLDDFTFEAVSELARDQEMKTGRLPTIVVYRDGSVSELPGHSLGIGKRKERIENYAKPIAILRDETSEEDVIKLFEMSPNINKAAVVNSSGSVIGIIYPEDVLRLIQKNSSTKLYDIAGVNKEEDVHDSALVKIRYRHKWLILNLFTAFLAAFVVGMFEDTISAFVLLAAYMPVVAGMGGNAGTQTMAVFVRGLALREISFSTAKRAIANEIIAGAANGVINGLIVMLIAIVWNKSALLGLVVGVSMIINLMVAGFFGAIVPLMMKKLGKDPASSATVFITTATDIFGFFVFLSLATLVLV